MRLSHAHNTLATTYHRCLYRDTYYLGRDYPLTTANDSSYVPNSDSFNKTNCKILENLKSPLSHAHNTLATTYLRCLYRDTYYLGRDSPLTTAKDSSNVPNSESFNIKKSISLQNLTSQLSHSHNALDTTYLRCSYCDTNYIRRDCPLTTVIDSSNVPNSERFYKKRFKNAAKFNVAALTHSECVRYNVS